MMPQTFTLQKFLQKTAQTESTILREHFILQAFIKISRYQAECGLFERKYGCGLDAMQQNIQTENFSIEDDLIDWEYANSALQWWKTCLSEFQYVT